MLKDIDLKSLAQRAWKEFRYFLSNPVPLSFSKISTYQNCAYKYKIIYEDGHPGKPSPYLAFGTVVHNTLYEYESIQPEKRGYEDLERLFRKNWDIEVESYRRKWGKSLYEMIAAEKTTPAEELEKEAYDKGILILKNYWKTSLGNPNKVRHVEKWVFAELFKYHITGRLDRVDQHPNGAYEIIDYKTGERIYDQTTLKDASRGYGLQAGLYYEMTREAWRDRVERFVFRYLQKRQDFLDYLMGRWMDAVHTAARQALVAGTPSVPRPDNKSLYSSLTASVSNAVREKLEEKILIKIAADREEERVRGEIRKIGLEEEDEILKNIEGPRRVGARLFLKTLGKVFETQIKEAVDLAVHDPTVLAKYGAERTAIKAVLEQVAAPVLESAVGRFLEETEKTFASNAGAGSWPPIQRQELERIAREITEIIYHRDLKEYTEQHIRKINMDALAQSLAKCIEVIPEIPKNKRGELVRYVVDRLRSSFSRHLDVYPVGEMARIISESAPDHFLNEDYKKSVEKMLDELAAAAKIGDEKQGRKIPATALALARKKILVRPIFEAVSRILREIVHGVIADMMADRTELFNAEERQRYERILKALGDPIFVQLASRKISDAFSEAVLHDGYFKLGVVPIVKHVTDFFDRPKVVNILARLRPELERGGKEALTEEAQRLVENLNWGDVEKVVDESLRPGHTAYSQLLHDIAAPKIQSVLASMAAPDLIEMTLNEAAGLFENRLHRIVAEDVEVPYSKEMRQNIHRVIDEVQEGIRRKDFSMSKGALCGWCEYQVGCPAWCKYRAMCKDVCKDVYHCTKWFDEKSGKLVDGKPAAMSFEEYQRRVNEKFQVTDRSLFRLSFSKMNTYDLCPMNYRKLYLDRNPPKPKSFFSIGLTYHSTMEDLFAYTGPKKQPSLDDLKRIFDQKWISAGYRSVEEEDFHYRRGIRMCEDYYAKFIDGKYKPAFAREDYFEFQVGRTLLNGFIDRIDKNPDGSYVVVDYKTNPKVYTQEELEEDQQMTMYYLAAREGKLECSNYQAFEPKEFVFQFVNFCKDMVTYRKPDDLDAFVQRVAHFTEEMEWRQKTYKDSKYDPRVGMILFPPQDNKYCQSCDHHHICPIKSDVTVVDEIEEKGIRFEDFAIDSELLFDAADRKATVDAG